MISFETDTETKDAWETIKSHPKASRGFHTAILQRLLKNFIADFDNWDNMLHLDDDLRCKFERFQEHHERNKSRMLQIETQNKIYWNAMENAFKKTNIPTIYAKHEFDFMDEYIDMIRSRVFEQSEGAFSVPRKLIRIFVIDTIEELEASGELNRLRCNEQMKDYDDSSLVKIEN